MKKTIVVLIAVLIGFGVNCFAQGKVTNKKKQTTTTQNSKPRTKQQISNQKNKEVEFNDVLNGILYSSKTGNAEAHEENLQFHIDDEYGFLKIVIKNSDRIPFEDRIMLTEEKDIREYEEKNYANNLKQLWSYSPKSLSFTLPMCLSGDEDMVCCDESAYWKTVTVYGTGLLDTQRIFAYDDSSNTFTYCRTDFLNEKKQKRTRFVANNVSPSKWAEIKAMILNVMQDFKYIE